jgi:phosphohistidine phosphatase
MSILLIRHGHAVPERPGIDDGARWLSADGREQAARVGALVRSKGVALDVVVSSPLVRAVQTAELFARSYGYGGELECVPDLSFHRSGKQAAIVLQRMAQQRAVAAVGHMPTLAETATHLTAGAHKRDFSLCEALYIVDGRVVWSLTP